MKFSDKMESILRDIKERLFPTDESEALRLDMDIHIDEFEIYKDIKRSDWLHESLNVFMLYAQQKRVTNDKYIFLHIPLRDTEPHNYDMVQSLTYKWVTENIHEFTPPSFMFVSQEYLYSYYRFALSAVKIEDSSNFNGVDVNEFSFYYHIHYDNNEGTNVRSLYVFESVVDKYLAHGIRN